MRISRGSERTLIELAGQIVWAAEARSGFDLFFVVANTHATRERFPQALRAAAPDLAVLDLTDETRRFVAALCDDVPGEGLVLVTGFDAHARVAEARGSLFGGLNLDRDAIRRLERNLVFLLPSFALTVLAQSAPDFYDFRTVTLEAPEESTAEELAPLRTGDSLLALNPRDRQRWIEILQAQNADGSPEAAERQLSLARLLTERGDYGAAERILRNLLFDYALENSRRGTILNDLGMALWARSDLEGALEAYREAERIFRKANGDNHSSVATSVNNIGSVLQAQGDLEGGLRAYREAERIDRRVYGDDHPDVAINISNIGSVLGDQGDLDGALLAYREAERILRSVRGDDHPSVATSVTNSGSVLEARGDLEGALRAYREAERIDRASYGDDHPEVATDVGNIGSVLHGQGDVEGALRAYREAERIDRAVYGDDHQRVGRDINNIGVVLQSQGDLEGARQAYGEAFLMVFRAHGARGQNVATTARNVASVGGDPVALVRERFGEDAARELADVLKSSTE